MIAVFSMKSKKGVNMSNMNFNMVDSGKYQDVMFFNATDGYNACINGEVMPIYNFDTVLGLRKLGIPEIQISHADWKNFIKCVQNK